MRPSHIPVSLLALTLALPATAQNLPARKPGLWEHIATQTIQSVTSQKFVSQHCIDAETDQAMQAFGTDLIKAKCDRLDWRPEGSNRVLYAGCLYGDQPFKVYGIATGDLSADYKTTLTVTRIGRPEWPTMPPETVFNTAAKWIGACRAGQRPGDMTLANGQYMNIRDVPGVANLLTRETRRFDVALPVRKAGLWEIRSTFAGGVLPPQTQKQCVNAELDRAMMVSRSSDPATTCSETIGREAHDYVLTTKCTGAGATVARAVLGGDFERALNARISVRRADGQAIAPGLPVELVATQEHRWVSACESGMRPGDMIGADGKKTNIRDVAAGR